jgi:hypothetical protein
MTFPPIPPGFDRERALFADLFEIADNAALTGLSVEYDERYRAMDAQTRKAIDHAIERGEALRDSLAESGVPLSKAKQLVEALMRCPCEKHGRDIDVAREMAYLARTEARRGKPDGS